ncbi:MAG: isoprenylcysteine carboxylmethyltransferase family protein [Thermodesulfobacteriota bacterium]|nr:isoprenylcysteine carboxylmethyltransferase family protein [Thermodesulfobacteriota bacterium]
MSETRKIWYKLRGALIVPLYLIAVFYDQGDVCNPWMILPLGTALFGAGWFLRIYAQMHLHYRLKAHKTLTMTGPYVHVRNPIGNTLILVGINVLSGLLWFVPIMILGCAFTYHMTVLYEEGHLIEKYGEPYKAFIASIPRWIPRFSTPNRHPVAPDQVTPEQPVYDTGIHLHGAHFFCPLSLHCLARTTPVLIPLKDRFVSYRLELC